ncbi:dihydrofolate reductase family protein [Phycicoccus sp. MAQZ13P-2]|uniref:dihydrofolate reductase family protein n=1 Tax=Phycicoccus mangrovi TaxID=2840470 RepID=UPI001C00118F|nr:dihydrofolate reductase family protein [Phycicoccus mangrovi]MBT9273708.1 dihydrofolate reductase family protein [Phycicoccus mangrovi]
MAKLHYINNVSLDGYCEDEQGAFEWGPMPDDVFQTYIELLKPVGTFLYGRRLYETMSGWETMPALAEQSALTAEFSGVWKAPNKVVYSSTLTDVATRNTRIERTFDPGKVVAMKAEVEGELTIGGANLAAQAIKAGVVDEVRLFVWPITVGSGKPALPAGIGYTLLGFRRFDNGAVLLQYKPSAR